MNAKPIDRPRELLDKVVIIFVDSFMLIDKEDLSVEYKNPDELEL